MQMHLQLLRKIKKNIIFSFLLGSSSNRSWAQTVKGEEGQLHFSNSMDEVYKKVGWELFL